MKQEQNISVLIYTDTKDRYEDRSVLPGNTYDICPLSTLPWQQQLQFLRFSALPDNSTNWPPLPQTPLWSKSWKWYTALHAIQLYIYISIVSLWIVSFGVEQVNRSVMHLFLCQIFMILSCCCCCCAFHHNIYMLLLLLLFLLLCITHQEQ